MSRILVTGATGSWGTAIIGHYLKQTDHRIVGYSRSEFAQAQLRERFPDPRLDLFLGDIRDLPRLHLALEANIDVVIHCAALKRVDAIAYNPEESLKTNAIGSMNVLHAARGKVKKVLLISSDKAVQPTNLYGATKMIAEHLFVTYNAVSIPKGTASAVMRAGNVINSRGSVIPIWRAQMAQGLPLTLTDPRMTRFLLTFPRAIQMIETALDEMEGGEIFVPQLKAATMRELLRVVALDAYEDTEAAFRLYTKTTGLRPGGEKLHETLYTEEEAARARWHGDHAMIPPELHPWRARPWPENRAWPIDDWRRSDTAPRLGLEELRRLVGER